MEEQETIMTVEEFVERISLLTDEHREEVFRLIDKLSEQQE